jgi:hypothetical protein
MMDGGPSHLDTFDYKPKIARADFDPSPFEFRAFGKSGLRMANIFPNLSTHADDLCLLNGMYASSGEHTAARLGLLTGSEMIRRPALGAWSFYGMGTENEDLPGFVTIGSSGGVGVRGFSSAYLPSRYQGIRMDSGLGIPFLGPLRSKDVQKSQVELIRDMSRRLEKEDPRNSEIDAVARSFERAFAMQASVPKIMDFSKVDKKTKESYGNTLFGRKCLLASRLVQNGVRFVQLDLSGWDHHSDLPKVLLERTKEMDAPVAALIGDLKNQDLLKDTLIVWGGEFGRSPRMSSGGRDHNNEGFTMWMAGGGVKGGIRYGATDDIGKKAVDGRVSMSDLHATILYALGLDAEKVYEPWLENDASLRSSPGHAVKSIFR